MKQPSECQRLRETDKLRPVFTSDQIVQLIPAVKFRPSGRRDTAGVVRLPAAFLISLQFGFGLRCASDSFKKLRLDRLTLRLDRLLGFRRATLHQMILKSLLSVFHAGFRRSESALDLERLLLPLSDHIGFTAGAEEFFPRLEGAVNRDIQIRFQCLRILAFFLSLFFALLNPGLGFMLLLTRLFDLLLNRGLRGRCFVKLRPDRPALLKHHSRTEEFMTLPGFRFKGLRS